MELKKKNDLIRVWSQITRQSNGWLHVIPFSNGRLGGNGPEREVKAVPVNIKMSARHEPQ